MKEIIRGVAKDMLLVEENVPWDSVEGYWKVKRGITLGCCESTI